MKRYLITIGDTNDGDYVTEKQEISDYDLKRFIETLHKLPRVKDVNGNPLNEVEWLNLDMGDTGEILIKEGVLDVEEVSFLENYLPRGQHGIHTIDSIEVITVTDEIKLL